MFYTRFYFLCKEKAYKDVMGKKKIKIKVSVYAISSGGGFFHRRIGVGVRGVGGDERGLACGSLWPAVALERGDYWFASPLCYN